MSNPGADEGPTARKVLNALMEVSARLPEGLDSRLEVGVCDGTNLQLPDIFDITFYTRITASGSPRSAPAVLLKAHRHPGQNPGELMRGVTSDGDDELHRLIDGEEG
jgi:hypothetical protein